MGRLDGLKIHVLLCSMSVVLREQYVDFKIIELVGLKDVSTDINLYRLETES